MNKKMQKIVYAPLSWVLHLAALLPLPVLYAFSDFLYFITYHVVGYRKPLVRANLAASFPEKTDEERKLIEKRFYRNFTDVFVETIKLLHISDREMRRRVVFEGTEAVEAYTKAGKSVALYAAHFGNWEWLTSITLWMDYDREKVRFSQVYRPLRNQWFDRFYYRLRKRFHSDSLPKNGVLRALLKNRRNGSCFVTGFISDQKPSHNDGDHRILFLNQSTPFITGTELLLRKLNPVVMYFDMRREKRGYYRVKLRLITESPSECKEHEVTDAYARMLEEQIREQPDAWLWSHNRWRRAKK